MNKISSFAHFTSLSKRPISSAKSFKYPTSIPSPKNTSRKISNNIQSPTKDDELILIKRKFLNKSKHVKSTSTYLSFASPNNYIYLNKQNKLNSTIKSQLILTSMDNSSILHSKDKIFSYLNNSNYYSNNKNNSINRSLNNKSISICVRKKKDNNNSHTHSNGNIISNSSNQKKQFAFTAISSRKNSIDKNISQEKENKKLFFQNQKMNSMSFCNKSIYNNKTKSNNNIINDNNNPMKKLLNPNIRFYNNQYNHKFSINFLANYVKATKKSKVNNLSNKSISINNINISSGPIKNKKIISSTAKASPRSLYNLNSISSRAKKIKQCHNSSYKNYKDIKKNNNIINMSINNNSSNINNSMSIHDNLINNSNNNFFNGTKQKNNSSSKGKINQFNKQNIINGSDYINNLNINYNKINNINHIHPKITKILSQSQREILTKKFKKNLTTNNSPNKEKEKEKEREKEKEKEREKEREKLKEIKKEKSEIKKIQNKIIVKNNIKEYKKPKFSNSQENINEKYIKKLKENLEAKQFNPSTSTLSTSNHDSNYYQKQSRDLSLYISSYKKKYNEYPETSLSFYKYGRLIGQGAFGKVNLGLNVLTGRVVAVKSFNKQKLNNQTENKNKIFYETDLMKYLNHPNITKLLEHFESEKYYLIIMEYINGGNLFSFVKKRRKLSEKTAKFLFRQIIKGIKYIHSKNIVHRDIKLENILIDVNNNIKICDFGIGKILDNKNKKLHDQCGTPMYMAPEILLSTKEKGYDAFPVDLWSAGIALYIMLSGTLPFSINNDDISSIQNEEKKNNFALQYAIINNEPKNIDNISIEAKNLLSGLLNKNPKKRFTCDEVLNHPWLNCDNNNYKYHLFTKAEMIMLSKTYIDYRYAKIDDIKENFTLSNLEKDDKNTNNVNVNIRTKSFILAPYNSMKNYFQNDDDDDNDEEDDFNDISLKLENGIILFANKVREFNINYELNNNDELDNGMLINSKTETISTNRNNTISNNNINISNNNNINNNNNGYYYEDEKNVGTFNKNLQLKYSFSGNQNKNDKKKRENILNKIEYLGYDKNYVKECLKNNKICHATAIYYLMMNYENF